MDNAGNQIVTYTYDAWGNILDISGSHAETIGQYNPLRYRGYIYDTETQLYYLQSRYYDPEIGRFLNTDAFSSTGQGLLGNNMFACCLNNPVVCVDYLGQKAASVCFGEDPYVRHYGQGSAISMSIYHQSVYIDAYMTFYGDLPPESLIAGIKEYWEGSYTNGTYTYNVFITIHNGKSENGNTIMNRAGVYANFYDILKVIDANTYCIRQEWFCVGGL